MCRTDSTLGEHIKFLGWLGIKQLLVITAQVGATSPLFLLLFLIKFLLHCCLSCFRSLLELSNDLFRRWYRTIDPRMRQELIHGQSLTWLESKHLLYEILELIRVASRQVSFKGAPEQGWFDQQSLIELVIWTGLLEWRRTSDHHEENNGHREEIYLCAFVVGTLYPYLRCHVSLRSTLGVQVPRCGVGEAKVYYLYVHLIIKHHVLRLQVSVSDALVMAVFDSSDHLLEEIACHWLSELARLADELKDVRVQNFRHDVEHVFLHFALFNLDIVSVARIDVFKDVHVIQNLECVNFFEYVFDQLFFYARFEDLDGNLLPSGLVDTQLGLTSHAVTYGPYDGEVANRVELRVVDILVEFLFVCCARSCGLIVLIHLCQ